MGPRALRASTYLMLAMLVLVVILSGCVQTKPASNKTSNANVSGNLSGGITGNITQNESQKQNETQECRFDSDCVHRPACCHEGAGECIPASEARPVECKGVYCTMECRPCTQCRCISGKCVTIPVGGCC